MIFKNVKFYQLPSDYVLDVEALVSVLPEGQKRKIGSQEMKVSGWHFTQGDNLATVAHGFVTIKLATEERILPKDEIDKQLNNETEKFINTYGQPPTKKQTADMKAAIITKLMAQSFTKWAYTWATITPDNLIMIDTGSDSSAEILLASLRRVMGSLPVVPLIRRSINQDMTNMIETQLPRLEVTQQAFLNNVEGEEVKYKNVDVVSDEGVKNYIANGYLVTMLGVNFDDSIEGALCSDGSMKRIKFDARIMEENEDIPKDQADARFDADLFLNNKELNVLGLALVEMFGSNDDE